ncbi:MAG: sensor histidine kinase [Proteobacteria bacterium]|nr:sensor histidine kinase [Pseudomonadota bacterium]HQR03837.1 sensor histidine kinase [Rhodocyclaceae bacterium]
MDESPAPAPTLAAVPPAAATVAPAPRSRHSLRNRLLRFLLGPLLAVVAASVLLDYRNALGPANDAYDHALASSAVALAALVGVHHGRPQLELPRSAEAVLRTDPLDKIFYAVLDNDGHLVAGDRALASLSFLDGRNNPTFHDDHLGTQSIRVASYRAAGPGGSALVIVAETTHKREITATRTVAAILWSNLLLVAATLLTVFFAVRFALSPLLALGAAIAARTPGDLHPVNDSGVPEETRPLVTAINRLMAHLHEAQQAQQAFITHAAHQLRTPLAGMQTQLELAAETLPESERPRIERLRDAARRLSHFIHQMLALARSAPEADLAHEFQRVDLAGLCEDAASEFLDRALAKGIDLGFETAAAPILGSRWLLRELLANLIDNAIAYTPSGGHVTVRCGSDGRETWLEVEDNGAGIAEAERARIFDRFYRAAGSGAPGAGLGLAIVKEVVERHRGGVSLHTPANGVGIGFRIVFPGP